MTITKLYPLTREQQGLYVEFKRDPKDISYNTCVQVSLDGEIDVQRFRDAAKHAVNHFDMLRAYVVEKNFRPQLTFGDQDYLLPYTDYSTQSLNGQPLDENETLKQKALDKLDSIRLSPIPLDQFPLIHAHLIKTAHNKFYFIGVVPHLISDGVSATLFLQSLSVCYNEGETALQETFPAHDVSWPHYLAFRDTTFPKEKMDEASNYWQENLENASHQVHIGNKPCQRSSNIGQRYKFELDGESAIKLRKIARANKTALFSVFSASLAAFINRYYDAKDLVIGYPVNLRPAGYKNAFGFYVNVLPLKLNLEENPSFNDLIQRSHIQRKKDKPFQFLPSLDIVRSKRRSDVTFNGQMFNISMAETVSRLQNLNIDAINSTSLDNKTIEIKDDLSLIYEVGENGVSFWFEYLEELFTEKQIQDMAQHFIALLKQMANEPSQNIASFPILSQRETAALLKETSYRDQDLSIITEFQKSVQNNPSATALLFNDQSISYQDLDAKSDQIAISLINQLDHNQTFIALLLPFGIERIVAMLAALKAGLTYIPIDPETPINRIKTILSESKTSHIICLKPCDVNAKNLIFSDLEQNNQTTLNLKQNKAAYVIYTSGSTGIPKGVLVNHSEVVARLNWLKKTFPLKVTDKVLQSTNYSFDVSVAEIFWPLLSGASLVILDEEKRKDFKYQANLIIHHQIKAACMVPSALLALLKALNPNDRLPFTYLLSAGEALHKDLADTYYEFANEGTLFNVYGPTEAVIYASYAKVVKGEDITIGQHIDDCDLYILNAGNHLQPQFAYGELHIGGALAQGYLNNAEQTKATFIQNPYANGLLYKTGDLVYSNQDNNIKYLGRIDNQVKIRGYRIEMDEITSKINDLAEIDESCIIINQHNQLVACYVCNSTIMPETITHYLKDHLPSYMVPHQLVHFDSFPTLASGKINVKKITQEAEKSLIHLSDKDQKKLILPKTKKEKLMATIWANILRIPVQNIGINSNFFALGGDSLMVIELECLCETEEIYLDTKTIFANPTIAGLIANASDVALNHFEQGVIEGEINLLPRHEKFFADDFKHPNQWNRCISIESKKEVNIDLFTESFAEILNYHDGLRLSFQKVSVATETNNKQWKCYNHGTLEPIVNTYDFSDIAQHDQATHITQALNKEHASFDLSKPPLIKIAYFKLKNKYQLSLIIHHLLVDMRSCRIILEDLMMNFMAKSQKEPFLMPYKTSPIRDYAKKLRDYIHHHDFEDEINYWQGELSEIATSPQVLLTESELNHASISFDKKQTKNVIAAAKENDITIHAYLISKLASLYKKHFNHQNLTLNTCFHGRDDFLHDTKITKTVGWFNTVFPVKIDLTSANITKQIKDKFNHIPNRSLNYLPLRFIQKDPRLTSLPEPKIFFNYVSKIDKELPKEFAKKLPLTIIQNDNSDSTSTHEKSCYDFYIEVALVADKLEIKTEYSQTYASLAQDLTTLLTQT